MAFIQPTFSPYAYLSSEPVDLTGDISESFALSFTNTSGESGEVAATMQGGAQLHEVASLVQRFLVAAGFTYVTEVVIKTGDGNDVSSNY